MKRIDEIKKKTKLSMDEMYSCTSESKAESTDVSKPTKTAIQQNSQEPYKKITLYLKFYLYKEFNNIYARRMLEGRKTDKSELICEAIELLVEKEKNNYGFER